MLNGDEWLNPFAVSISLDMKQAGKRDPNRPESHAKQGSQHLSALQGLFTFVENRATAFYAHSFGLA
ncbi:hypothetical protein [Paraburkholderia bryophila]|uniref:Uncharacterized protein n=1 Tax=Paraburkholderia bryophila TaxID=420952 RepID=A0A7Y9W2U5_9BURK|nr:hypothetical protein [Paraburkholderia bryophila]NYH12947.1 hypothetical protein [Paraburkholderia bryophila]